MIRGAEHAFASGDGPHGADRDRQAGASESTTDRPGTGTMLSPGRRSARGSTLLPRSSTSARLPLHSSSGPFASERRPQHHRASRNRSGRAALVLALALAGAGFLYGFAAGKAELFPHDLLERGWRAVGGSASDAARPDPAEREDPRPGMWLRARERAAGGEEPDMQSVRDLAGLGYMDGYQEADGSPTGVVGFDAERAYDGWNLVVSGHAPSATLVDMDGRVAHEWTPDLTAIFSDVTSLADATGFQTFWRRAYVFPNGDLLAIFDGIGMVKLDRDSRLLWSNMGRMHHDLEVLPDGSIWTLVREERAEHERLELQGPIEEDFVVLLSAGGEELRRVSVLQAFLDSDYAPVVSLADRKGDILHTNTIELMDGRFAEQHPLFARGRVLVSCPTVNTIAVLDLDEERVVWALTGLWQFQHQPTVTDGGHILVFDNLGERGASRVLEIDPLSQEVVWSYRDTAEHPFSSYFLGSCQRLPGGNTLITESAGGRAFEVTPDGTTVWLFANPNRAGEADELVASLLEIVRIERDFFDPDFAAALARDDG